MAETTSTSSNSSKPSGATPLLAASLVPGPPGTSLPGGMSALTPAAVLAQVQTAMTTPGATIQHFTEAEMRAATGTPSAPPTTPRSLPPIMSSVGSGPTLPIPGLGAIQYPLTTTGTTAPPSAPPSVSPMAGTIQLPANWMSLGKPLEVLSESKKTKCETCATQSKSVELCMNCDQSIIELHGKKSYRSGNMFNTVVPTVADQSTRLYFYAPNSQSAEFKFAFRESNFPQGPVLSLPSKPIQIQQSDCPDCEKMSENEIQAELSKLSDQIDEAQQRKDTNKAAELLKCQFQLRYCLAGKQGHPGLQFYWKSYYGLMPSKEDLHKICTLPQSELELLLSNLLNLQQKAKDAGLTVSSFPFLRFADELIELVRKCLNPKAGDYNPRRPTGHVPKEVKPEDKAPRPGGGVDPRDRREKRGQYQQLQVTINQHCEYAIAILLALIKKESDAVKRGQLTKQLESIQAKCPGAISGTLSKEQLENLMKELSEFPIDQDKCGPDVTKSVQDALKAVICAWSKCTNAQKESLANELINWVDAVVSGGGGAVAWDIIDLFGASYDPNNPKGLVALFRPFCGLSTRCYQTVWYNGRCFYAGSLNYMVLGVMFKLCWLHYGGSGDSAKQQSFSKSALQSIIEKWKGPAKQVRYFRYVCNKSIGTIPSRRIVSTQRGDGRFDIVAIERDLTPEEIKTHDCVLQTKVEGDASSNYYTSQDFAGLGWDWAVADWKSATAVPDVSGVEPERGDPYSECLKCDWNGGASNFEFEVRWNPIFNNQNPIKLSNCDRDGGK